MSQQLSFQGLTVEQARERLAKDGGKAAAPAWARGGTALQRSRAARGYHPTGVRLRVDQGDGETCGSCAHCVVRDFHGRNYIKCGLMVETRGPGTDIRKKWPACDRWEGKVDE